MKGSSVLPNISKGMASPWKGCVNLFCSQVGRDKLSLHELNKGTLVYSQAEAQGPPGKPWSVNNNKPWSIDYNNKSKKKSKSTKVSNMESELASSLQHFCSSFLIKCDFEVRFTWTGRSCTCHRKSHCLH